MFSVEVTEQAVTERFSHQSHSLMYEEFGRALNSAAATCVRLFQSGCVCLWVLTRYVRFYRWSFYPYAKSFFLSDSTRFTKTWMHWLGWNCLISLIKQKQVVQCDLSVCSNRLESFIYQSRFTKNCNYHAEPNCKYRILNHFKSCHPKQGNNTNRTQALQGVREHEKISVRRSEENENKRTGFM